jgi:hypothetical protein
MEDGANCSNPLDESRRSPVCALEKSVFERHHPKVSADLKQFTRAQQKIRP